jgi:hypothetical protein
MKISHLILPILVASTAVALCADDPSGDSFLNHLSFSAQLGFNIRAHFGPRITPDGMLYNYIDGYVLMDSTGDYDPTGTYLPPQGITQNWGYDNSGSQAKEVPTILMTRSAPGTDLASRSFGDDPQLGAELTYTHELGARGKLRYGIEAAVNYMNLCLRDDSSSTGPAIQDTYSYAFPGIIGNTPPPAPTAAGQPYQGRYSSAQPGFNISDTPVSSAPVTATVASHCQFDADLWGFRLGPYLEYPLGTNVNLSVSGGLAVGLLDSTASWAQTVSINGVFSSSASGSGNDFDVLWGGYVNADITWRVSKRWSATGGVRCQDLGTYQHALGGRQIELDLRNSIFVTLGIGYSF